MILVEVIPLIIGHDLGEVRPGRVEANLVPQFLVEGLAASTQDELLPGEDQGNALAYPEGTEALHDLRPRRTRLYLLETSRDLSTRRLATLPVALLDSTTTV